MTLQNKMVFCTLFDSNYLDKGLALIHSMKKYIKEYKLYVFAFDDRCFRVLSDMKMENVIIVPLENIMTDRLQQIKEERTCAEFCWTCTPVIIEHVLLKLGEKMCTYIDADIYFFADPCEVIQEILDHDCSVGLVCHGFERNYEYIAQILKVGKYCIQFNTFLNNKDGVEVLEEWKEDCLNWCYNRCEDGKLGDQKYPDKWRQKYSCVHESRNSGAGVAPWNLHLYSYLGKYNGKIWLKGEAGKFPLIFYHFEAIRYLPGGKTYLNLWRTGQPEVRTKMKMLYGAYFKEVDAIRAFLRKTYGITFEHMIVDENAYSKKKYSLKHFCGKYGLIEGAKIWRRFWRNNIVWHENLYRRRS